ncbi:hypothetical protein F5Y03DRAFT_362515 [Xylaria venustula]|nr:hypothetical protein F5Y03DRAFT_362515 [Xylaria venustula]
MPHAWGHASGLILLSSSKLGVAVEMPPGEFVGVSRPFYQPTSGPGCCGWYLTATLPIPHLQEVPETDQNMIGFDVGSRGSVSDRISALEKCPSPTTRKANQA